MKYSHLPLKWKFYNLRNRDEAALVNTSEPHGQPLHYYHGL